MAIEQLSRFHNIISLLDYVLMLPILFIYIWNNRLHKIADLILTIPLGGIFWSKSIHEPLILDIIIPIAIYSPFKRRRSKKFM